MGTLMALPTWLEGKKLFIALIAGGLAILVNHFIVPIPGLNLDTNNWLTDIWALVLLAFGGAKVNRVEDAQKQLLDVQKQHLDAVTTHQQLKESVPLPAKPK